MISWAQQGDMSISVTFASSLHYLATHFYFQCVGKCTHQRDGIPCSLGHGCWNLPIIKDTMIAVAFKFRAVFNALWSFDMQQLLHHG